MAAARLRIRQLANAHGTFPPAAFRAASDNAAGDLFARDPKTGCPANQSQFSVFGLRLHR
jgi:hypothetical protein